MTKREFTYSDGKSDKFWNIDIEGDHFSVTYGRTGTAGQSQTKSFDDESAAQVAADKLIVEKVKKGYLEAVSTSGEVASAATTSKTTPQAARKSTPKTKEPAPVFDEVPAPDLPLDDSSIDWNLEEKPALRLEASDWLWATWREHVPSARTEAQAKPFDKEEALQRLDKVPGKQYWSPQWQNAKIAAVLSREEAQFWFTAMTLDMKYNPSGYQALFRQAVQKQIAGRDYDGNLTRDQVVKTLTQGGVAIQSNNPLLVEVLLNLFSPIELVELCLEAESNIASKSKQRYNTLGLLEGLNTAFRHSILPFLLEGEVDALRDLLRPKIKPQDWPTDFYQPPKAAFHLAAQLGMPEELSALVRSWRDDLYTAGEWHDHYHRPQEVVFGLGSASEVETQMRRLKLLVSKPEWVRAWFAHTEFSAPDWVKTSILSSRGEGYRSGAKDVAEVLTQAFALAEAPEIAPEMLQLLLESKAPRVAREWLDAHPSHTIRGLVAVAAGRGKLAEAAVEQLRALKKRGAQEAISEAAKSLPSDELARLQSAVLSWTEKTYEPFTTDDAPKEVRMAIEAGPPLKIGKTWIHAIDLPPIAYGTRRLSDAQAEALLVALRSASHPLTSAVKAGSDKASLDAFAWKLFERWLGEGAPSKEKWAMLALGQLGGDECALKLTPLIRAWPGESQHQRAVTGLECLRAIGTDTALMQINGIAQKVKFKGLQSKAVEAMEGIASDRGLSRSQLEDRVVPTLDLDERGTRIFDYGSRQFRFVLSPEMKPLVREVGAATAKPRPDLPSPRPRMTRLKPKRPSLSGNC